MLLLLLEQSLMEGLLEKGLRGLRWRATLSGLRALRWLLRTSYSPSTWPCITTWQASHGILLLLLLHLEVVLVLEPLLQCLLLRHRPWVNLSLLARGTTRLRT